MQPTLQPLLQFIPERIQLWSTHSHKLFSHSKHGKTCLNKWLHGNKGIKFPISTTMPLYFYCKAIWCCGSATIFNFPMDYRGEWRVIYYTYPWAVKQEADSSRCDVIPNPLVYSQTISQPCIPHCAAIIKSLIRQGVDVEWDDNRNSPLAQFFTSVCLVNYQSWGSCGNEKCSRSDMFLWKTGPPREIYSCESNDISGIKGFR